MVVAKAVADALDFAGPHQARSRRDTQVGSRSRSGRPRGKARRFCKAGPTESCRPRPRGRRRRACLPHQEPTGRDCSAMNRICGLGHEDEQVAVSVVVPRISYHVWWYTRPIASEVVVPVG